MYVPSYHLNHKVQYKVGADSTTYGDDLMKEVSPLRDVLQVEVMVIKDRSTNNGFFNCLTFFAGIDLNGFAENNQFRPTFLGLMFGI
jgi:hypothetical protein